jgi:predicted Zn-ribbon and HTH transcriptional regulator
VGEEQRPIIQRQSIFVRPLQLLQQRLQIQPENEEEAKIQEFLEEKRKKELLEELKKAEQAKKRGGRKTKERGKFRKGKIADGGYNMTRGRFVVTEESPPLGPKQGQTR